MKRQIIFLFGIFIIINLMSFKPVSIFNDELVMENYRLKKRISELEQLDKSKSKVILELNKMNVVYRGVANPVTISIPNATKLEASAPGLIKIDDFGNYTLSPGSGLNVDLKIKGILGTGDTISEMKSLRIKDIGKPMGIINNKSSDYNCMVELKKEQLKNGVVNVKVDDFLFDLDISVSGFKIKMPDETSLRFEGNIINQKGNLAIENLNVEDLIIIYDIRWFSQNHKGSLCLPTVKPIKIKIIG